MKALLVGGTLNGKIVDLEEATDTIAVKPTKLIVTPIYNENDIAFKYELRPYSVLVPGVMFIYVHAKTTDVEAISQIINTYVRGSI